VKRHSIRAALQNRRSPQSSLRHLLRGVFGPHLGSSLPGPLQCLAAACQRVARAWRSRGDSWRFQNEPLEPRLLMDALPAPTHARYAMASPTSAIVYWNDNSNNAEQEDNFIVTLTPAGGSPITQTVSANTGSYDSATFTDLTPGITYGISVTAHKEGAGDATDAEAVSFALPVLGRIVAPSHVISVVGEVQGSPVVDLYWNDDSIGESDSDGYQVDVQSQSTGEWMRLSSVMDGQQQSHDMTHFQVTSTLISSHVSDLVADETYTYRVRAKGTDDAQYFSPSTTATIPHATSGSVYGIVERTEGSIHVIDFSGAGTIEVQLTSYPLQGQWVNTGQQSGTSVADLLNGWGAASNIRVHGSDGYAYPASPITLSNPLPAGPSSVTAATIHYTGTSYEDGQYNDHFEANLTWVNNNAISNPAPSSLAVVTSRAGYSDIVRTSLSATATNATFNLSSKADGFAAFALQYRDGSGVPISQNSSVFVIPGTPKYLTGAQFEPGKTRLVWDEPGGIGEGYGTVQFDTALSFHLEEQIAGEWTTIATTDDDAFTFGENGVKPLEPNTHHVYRVVAVNDGGHDSENHDVGLTVESKPSNTFEITAGPLGSCRSCQDRVGATTWWDTGPAAETPGGVSSNGDVHEAIPGVGAQLANAGVGFDPTWTNESNLNLAANDPMAMGNGLTSKGNGRGINAAEQAKLEVMGNGNIMAINGTVVNWYLANPDGSYTATVNDGQTLRYDLKQNKFILNDGQGDRSYFAGFATSNGAPTVDSSTGRLASYIDASGAATQLVYGDRGLASSTMIKDNITEATAFAYGSSDFLLREVTDTVSINQGTTLTPTWVTASTQTAVYNYYSSTDTSYGNPGDLKSVVVTDNGQVQNATYRYYQGGVSDAGPAHALRMVIGPDAYDRAVAAGFDPLTASDAALAPYADVLYTYNAGGKVVSVQFPGRAAAATTSTMNTSTTLDGHNVWRFKTVETNSNNTTATIYTNYLGQVMLKATQQGASQWIDYYRYDDSGNLILHANPSAVTGYNDTLNDLVGYQNGTAGYLSGTSGLIETTSYYNSTTAAITSGDALDGQTTTAGSVVGYPESSAVQQGMLGTPIEQTAQTYFGHQIGRSVLSLTCSGSTVTATIASPVNYSVGDVITITGANPSVYDGTFVIAGVTSTTFSFTVGGTPGSAASGTIIVHSANDPLVWKVATSSEYPTTNVSDARTTTYSYQFFPGLSQIQEQTTALPKVPVSQNGPWTADVQTQVFDDQGNMIWSRDPDGYLTYNQYDPATGALIKTIQDADTTNTGQFTIYANGILTANSWSTPTGGGLNLTSLDAVDSLGRTTQTTDPNGNVTYTVYDDAHHAVFTFPGATIASGTLITTGPITMTRDDLPYSYISGGTTFVGTYSESLTFSGTVPVTGGVMSLPGWSSSNGNLLNLVGNGTSINPQYTIHSLSRGLYTPSIQTRETDAYFNISNNAYLATATGSAYTGSAGINFYQTLYGYDEEGQQNREVSPTGTITRTVYDNLGRAMSTWMGTNDINASSSDPTGGSSGIAAGNNMFCLTIHQYDAGGVGDGNLTRSTNYPGGSMAPRSTSYVYDWRDRLITAKEGVTATENDGAHRPLKVNLLDNLGETLFSYTFDGDGVSLTDTSGMGIPDALVSAVYPNGINSPPATTNDTSTGLISLSTATYDEQGRAFRSALYSVDPNTYVISSSALVSNSWYDKRGNVIKSVSAGSATTKSLFDGAGRQIVSYVTAGGDDGTWAAALTVGSDTVLSQTEYTYDADSNVILTASRDRFSGETALGALGDKDGIITNSSGTSNGHPKARVSYSIGYYDSLGRVTDSVALGTNGGSLSGAGSGANLDSNSDGMPDRPATIPTGTTLALLTHYHYNAAGLNDYTIDPRGIKAASFFDALGRTLWSVAAWDGSFDPSTGAVPAANSNDTDQTTAYTYDGDGHTLTLTAVMPAGTPSQTTIYTYGVSPATGSVISSNDLLRSVTYGSTFYFAAESSVAGSSQDDSFSVIRDASDSSKLDVYNGLTLLGTYSVSGLYAIVFNGQGGTDSLTLDTSYGSIDLPGGYLLNGTGTDTLFVTGTNALTLAQDVGLFNDHVDFEARTGTQVIFASSQHLASLTLDAGSVVTLGTAATDGHVVLVTGELAIAGGATPTAKLDLRKNGLAINLDGSSASSEMDLIRQQIAVARNNGNWNGAYGITSSVAAGNPNTTLGYASNMLLPLLTNWGDAAITRDSVLIRYAYLDDLMLDGTIDSNDAITLAAHYRDGAAAIFQYGDLDDDGVFTSNDAIIFALHYSEASAPIVLSTQGIYQEFMSYDALGEATQYTDRNGTAHAYAYDILGRRISDTVTVLSGNSHNVDLTVTQIGSSYNSQGLVDKVTSYNGSGAPVNQVKNLYNGLGQLTQQFQEHSGTVNGSSPSVQYGYSTLALGARLISMTYPNGRVLSYNYTGNNGIDNAIGRLSSISDYQNTLEAYSYLGLSTVVDRAHPQTGVDLTYIQDAVEGYANMDAGDAYTGLDRFGRVIDQNWVNTTTHTPTDRFQYGYDADSNVLFKGNLVDANQSELYHANGAGYGYDALNRLTGFSRAPLSSSQNNGVLDTILSPINPSRSQSWTYDALGNMLSIHTDGTTQTRTTNTVNEITSISGAATPTYDSNGNTLSDDTGQAYTYDAWNRLISTKRLVNSAWQQIACYNYDGTGKRISEGAQVPTQLTLTGSSSQDTFAIASDGNGHLTASVNGNPFATFPAGCPIDLTLQGGAGGDTLSVSGGALVRFAANTNTTTPGLAITVSGTGSAVEFQANEQLAGLTAGSSATVTFIGGNSASLNVGTLALSGSAQLNFKGGNTSTLTATTISITGSAKLYFKASSNSTLTAGTSTTLTTSGQLVFLAGSNGTFNAGALSLASSSKLDFSPGSGHLNATSTSISGATLTLFGGGAVNSNVFETGTMAMDSTALLDLSSNKLIVDSGSVSAIRSLLVAGRNGGGWYSTHGIISSAANAEYSNDSYEATALGYSGHQGDTGVSVTVMYTLVGDANLDGTVDDTDLALYSPPSGTDWVDGDTNYDGTVDGTNDPTNAGNNSYLSITDFSPGYPRSTVTIAYATPTIPMQQRDLYYSSAGQDIEERKGGSTSADIQYVYSLVYANAPILRDSNADADTGTGSLGQSGSGLEQRIYYQQDANFNATAILIYDTGSSSWVVGERYLFDPYGKVTITDLYYSPRSGNTSTYSQNILYQGGHRNPITGNYLFGYREYDPEIMRWLQQDPAGYFDGLNRYRSDRDNPINRVDPTGLDPWGLPMSKGGTGEEWTGGMVRPAYETVTLKFDAFIPKGIGKPNGLYGAGEWAPEPYSDQTNGQYNPWAIYGNWNFQTDDRTFGEQGTSRVYSIGTVSAADIGHLKSKGPIFTDYGTSGSRRARWVTTTDWLGENPRMHIDQSPLEKAAVTQEEKVWDISPCESKVYVHASAGYPFIWKSPHIDYYAYWDLVKSGSDVKVYLWVEHDKFPGYEGLVNGELIYKYDPAAHGETGPGTVNLTTTTIGKGTNDHW
jgi:RHS repeat-associated protein